MNRQLHLWSILFALITMLPLISCDKKNRNVPDVQEGIKYTTSRKTNYGDDWIYFSFSKGKEVAVDEANHANDLSWDIAFNGRNIRTNGGASGKGNGGAFDGGQKNFDLARKAPVKGYVEDEGCEIIKNISTMPPPKMKSTANPILSKAISFSGPPPEYHVSDHVYYIRTADGKYAKLIFMSFFKKEISGIITFKYVYQPNGKPEF